MDRLLANGTVNAAQLGNGQPLVLLHSLLSDRASFDAIVPRLSQSFRVIVPELPGFGQSRAVSGGLAEVADRMAEAVIDAAGPKLRLAKIEGDAAFFYLPLSSESHLAKAEVAQRAAAIYDAFHARSEDLKVNTFCPCDGCQQAGQLRIKIVSHAGDIVERKVGRSTELAGVDVILVHRLLKNDVPLAEYLLLTEPVYQQLDPASRSRAESLNIELDDLGPTPSWYLELAPSPDRPAVVPKLSTLKRLARHLGLIGRTLPFLVGTRKPCVGFRNLADEAATSS